MFLVADITIKPEAEDIERGWVRPEALVHLKLADAVDDLIDRIRFSLGYELDTELGEGEPELPQRLEAIIDDWRDRIDRDELNKVGALTINTRDYQHFLMPLAALS